MPNHYEPMMALFTDGYTVGCCYNVVGPFYHIITYGNSMTATDHKSDLHDDIIKWKHFPSYWPFVQGIHRSPVNSPHKGQWRGALMWVWINLQQTPPPHTTPSWVSYGVSIMKILKKIDRVITALQPMCVPLPGMNELRSNNTCLIINSLRAKFFGGNINMYLHLMSFLHTDMP